MSKFEQEREKHLREKYNVPNGALEYEHGKHFPKIVTETPENRHYARYVNDLKNKFQMVGLELEGHEAFKPKENQTVEDLVRESDKQEVKGMKLAIGSTYFRGKQLQIWYLKSK